VIHFAALTFLVLFIVMYVLVNLAILSSFTRTSKTALSKPYFAFVNYGETTSELQRLKP